MTARWVVAMSGGVDSSVAAALLARAGEDVVGITLDIGAPVTAVPDGIGQRCCGLPDVEDARAVARTLGIRHYTANTREAFRSAVIEPFAAEYAAGRTPIPCIACNRVLKFDLLIARARQLDALGVATGHYARIAPGPDGAPSLFRPLDRDKDQTYFLFDIPRDVLPQIRFPLGDLCKDQVREIAHSLSLVTAAKPESQGICFIPDGDVRSALHRILPGLGREPGPIVDRDGNLLGEHTGAAGYTTGQRRGLGLSGGPWYVAEVRVAKNELVVARESELWRGEVLLQRAIWHDAAPPQGEVRVQVRHRHAAAAARVRSSSADGVVLAFAQPVRSPAPGQAAVVYDAADERLLGGGWIAGTA